MTCSATTVEGMTRLNGRRRKEGQKVKKNTRCRARWQAFWLRGRVAYLAGDYGRCMAANREMAVEGETCDGPVLGIIIAAQRKGQEGYVKARVEMYNLWDRACHEKGRGARTTPTPGPSSTARDSARIRSRSRASGRARFRVAAMTIRARRVHDSRHWTVLQPAGHAGG